MRPPRNPGNAAEPKLAHSLLVAVAGVPVLVETSSEEVAAAARSRYPMADAGSNHRCRLEVHVDEHVDGHGSAEVRWRFPAVDRAEITGPGLMAVVQLDAGRAVVRMTPGFLRDGLLLRRLIFEGVVFSLLTRHDRYPIHASAIREGDSGILLYGPSGVGKSTMAYVAHQEGLGVLADDASRVQLEPELRVWGDGTGARILLLEQAREAFDALRRQKAEWVTATGTTKLSVELPAAGPGLLPFVRNVRVCLLSRDGQPLRLRQARASEIRDTILQGPEAAFDLAPSRRRAVVDALAAAGGWHLALSDDPREAIPYVREMLRATHEGRLDR
jgi:hypothetical protein